MQVTDVTSRSVTLQWSPPFNTGGVELTGYIIEKRLATTHKWERLATVDTSVTLHTIENLKEKSQYYFRVSAENEIGAGETAATEKVSLQTHARKLPLHFRSSRELFIHGCYRMFSFQPTVGLILVSL